jgi:hypothetical protein
MPETAVYGSAITRLLPAGFSTRRMVKVSSARPRIISNVREPYSADGRRQHSTVRHRPIPLKNPIPGQILKNKPLCAGTYRETVEGSQSCCTVPSGSPAIRMYRTVVAEIYIAKTTALGHFGVLAYSTGPGNSRHNKKGGWLGAAALTWRSFHEGNCHTRLKGGGDV